MGCRQLSTPEECLAEAREKLKKFTDFAIAHHDFAAAFLADPDGWDKSSESVRSKFEETVRLRNLALGF